MLWRQPYSTRVLAQVQLPAPHGLRLDMGAWKMPERFVLVGGFSARAYGEMEIWRRLLAAEVDAPVVLAFIFESLTSFDRRDIEAVLPPSLHESVLLVEGEVERWRNVIEPDKPERSFAAGLVGGSTKVLMVGPPTEEAWDAFRAALSA